MDLFSTFDDDEDLPDDAILDVLTQIENENSSLVTYDNKENASKTINVNTLSNVSNVGRHPMMPTMYFPNSTVTINYNISK